MRPGPREPRRDWTFGWAAFGCAVLVFVGSTLLPQRSVLPLKVAGLLVLLAAIPLMFAPFVYLKRHGGVPTGRPYYETTVVVARGPFRLVRHPQYVGYALLMVGLSLIAFNGITLPVAAIGAALFYLQARNEERQCVAALGEAYRAYMEAVPRFNVVAGLVRLVRKRIRRR